MTLWFDAECQSERRRVRAAERRYRRTRCDVDRRAWHDKWRQLRVLYETKDSQHWRAKVEENKGDMKKLWCTFHGVLCNAVLDVPDDHTADDFATFFQDKVDVVRASTATTPSHDVRWRDTKNLSNWSTVTADEVAKLTGAAPCKTCSLDPIPTWLVKEMRGLLSPFISLLFQKSLFTGRFPTEFKEAIVHPLLKKSGLDSTKKKNYRPVSNLSFLSKLLERVAQARLEVFLDSSDLIPTMQSAYRRFHSTETAVMKVYNDLLLAADNGDVSALCLLDHDLMMLKLERQFGLRGVVLDWFRSYLCGRTYRVIHGG